ncbi:MAG: hypothetical protein MRY83_12365, partial [Flavobacteriales bacterium]|nr:hypothetical protein [Flavobacteriales bacterium]
KFGQVNRNLGFRNVGSGGKTNAVLGKIHEGFSLFKLDQLEQNKIQDFPPLTVPFGRYTVSNNTSVLMHQRIGTLNTKYPLVIFSELNKKMGSILGEGIWRWRIHNFDKYENHNLFDDFISKTIQFLALKEDKRKFRVEVDHKFLENQSIEFKSELYNKNYELINDPEVELSIRDDNDKIFKYSFNRTGDFYTVDIGHLPEGRYTYFAKTSLNGEELNGSGSFVVSSIQLEKTEVTANHIMMRSLSKRTGGLSIAPEQLVNLGDSLQRRGDLKPVIYEKTDFENVMDLEWLLFLIILIFSFEWMLRKQNGIF